MHKELCKFEGLCIILKLEIILETIVGLNFKVEFLMGIRKEKIGKTCHNTFKNHQIIDTMCCKISRVYYASMATNISTSSSYQTAITYSDTLLNIYM